MNQGLKSLGPDHPRFIYVEVFNVFLRGSLLGGLLLDIPFVDLAGPVLNAESAESSRKICPWRYSVFVWIIWLLSFVCPKSFLRGTLMALPATSM